MSSPPTNTRAGGASLTLRLVPPHASGRGPAIALAPRRVDWAGAAVGLLANGKPNSDQLLDAMAEELNRRHGVGALVRLRKAHPSLPADPDQLEMLVERCDLVLSAVGD